MSKRKAAKPPEPTPRYAVLHCFACDIGGSRVWITPRTAERLAEVSAKKRDELERKGRIRRLDDTPLAPTVASAAPPPLNEETSNAGTESSD